MKAQLFAPFDLGKWFVVGFTAWLATLGEGGCSADIGEPIAKRSGDISGFIASHFALIVTGLAVLALIGIGITIALMWVRARGHFMLLDNAVHNRQQVLEPWRRFELEGNSYLRWMLGYVVVAILLIGVVAGVAGFSAAMSHGAMTDVKDNILLMAAVIAVILIVVVSITFAWMLFTDFSTILMYKHGILARDAWREILALFRSFTGEFILYGLMKFLVSMGIGLAYVVVGFLTCCCGLVLLAIPYIGAVLMLPLTLFLRHYANGFLAQFGERYDVDAKPETPAPQPPPDLPALDVESSTPSASDAGPEPAI